MGKFFFILLHNFVQIYVNNWLLLNHILKWLILELPSNIFLHSFYLVSFEFFPFSEKNVCIFPNFRVLIMEFFDFPKEIQIRESFYLIKKKRIFEYIVEGITVSYFSYWIISLSNIILKDDKNPEFVHGMIFTVP